VYRRQVRAASTIITALAVTAAAPTTGCKFADHDPIGLLAGRAPPAAADCGHAFGDPDELRASRACALDALAAGRPFMVASSPDSADGYSAVGWGTANDPAGPAFLRLDYSMAIGFMFPGTDSEEWSWTGCTSLESRGADCATLANDLCLGCVRPVAVD
jgi:hypothetical protein